MVDWQQIGKLVRSVGSGDLKAWPELVALLEPALTLLARGSNIGRLKARNDAVRDICVRVLEKLHAKDHDVLRKLAALEEPPNIRAWLRVLVRRTAIDYMRTHREFKRVSKSNSQPGWVSLVTLTTGAGVEPTDSIAEKRKMVMSELERCLGQVRDAKEGDAEAIGELAKTWGVSRLVVRRLMNKGERFEPVLGLLFQGHNYREIADKLELTRREVELTVRYAEELLSARLGKSD